MFQGKKLRRKSQDEVQSYHYAKSYCSIVIVVIILIVIYIYNPGHICTGVYMYTLQKKQTLYIYIYFLILACCVLFIPLVAFGMNRNSVCSNPLSPDQTLYQPWFMD